MYPPRYKLGFKVQACEIERGNFTSALTKFAQHSTVDVNLALLSIPTAQYSFFNSYHILQLFAYYFPSTETHPEYYKLIMSNSEIIFMYITFISASSLFRKIIDIKKKEKYYSWKRIEFLVNRFLNPFFSLSLSFNFLRGIQVLQLAVIISGLLFF